MATSISALMGGGIKSVQRGIINMGAVASVNATISAVDVKKSELRYLGTSTSSIEAWALGRIFLTNSTTITAEKGRNEGGTVVSWELTEWY